MLGVLLLQIRHLALQTQDGELSVSLLGYNRAILLPKVRRDATGMPSVTCISPGYIILATFPMLIHLAVFGSNTWLEFHLIHSPCGAWPHIGTALGGMDIACLLTLKGEVTSNLESLYLRCCSFTMALVSVEPGADVEDVYGLRTPTSL